MKNIGLTAVALTCGWSAALITIGRFLKALEEAGLAENTIIVYSADNGFFMGNRGFAGKWSHYEDALRVPLIVVIHACLPNNAVRLTMHSALNLDFPATFWIGRA